MYVVSRLHEPHSSFTLLGHRFDPDTPIGETVGVLALFQFQGTNKHASDASTPRRSQGWVCALHRDVILLGLAMYVSLCVHKTNAYYYIYLRSPCNAKYVHWSSRKERSDYRNRLRDQQQSNTIHLYAKSLQSPLSGGGARNVPYPQGGYNIPHLLDMPLFTCITRLQHFGVGSIPWSPLARGLLTRPFIAKNETVRGKTDRCALIYRPDLTKLNHLGLQDNQRV